MIDYPSGKIELALILFFEYLEDLGADLKEIYAAGKERIKEYRKMKFGFFIPVALIVLILLVGLFIYDYINQENSVTVSMKYSRDTVATEYKTSAKHVDKFLEENDIEYYSDVDGINVQMRHPITDGLKIEIVKGVECTLTVDGETYDFKSFPPITTKDVLDYYNITLDDMDLINFELNEELEHGDEIVVQRVKMKYVVETEEIPFEVKYQGDSSLTIGKTEVKTKGRKGITENSYLIVYIDGEEVSRTLASSKVIKKKRDKVISYGTHILSGVPKDLKYKKKFTHVRAVSYNYDHQRYGAYGGACKYGTCAVDRKLIPLGSKIYVEGYGYAIANDVGSAIKGKTVDLYMEKMAQCGIWGARWTTVYLIE